MSPEREVRPEVSLGRLCAVARLGPGPAVAVARAVLDGLAALHRGGLVHGAITADAVMVDEEGGVRLAGDGCRPTVVAARLEQLQAEEVAAAWRLLAALLAASPVTAPTALSTLVGGPPRHRASAAMVALRAAAGELASEPGARRAAARLAELAAPLSRYRHGPPLPTRGALGAATVITAPVTGARGPATGGGRGRRRRVRLAAAGVAAAAAAATGLLATRGSTGPTSPATGAPDAAAVTPAPLPQAPPPPAIPDPPAPAPASAGTISSVSLVPTAGPCLPAARCLLQIRVELLPRSAATTVRLELELVDRCTGVLTRVALAPLPVPSSRSAARAAVTVRVPAGPAPAIVALTTAPARAASPPLLVATFLPTC